MSRSELATDNIEINWLTVFKCQDSFLLNIPNRHRFLSEIWGDTFFLFFFLSLIVTANRQLFCPKNVWLRRNRIRMLSQICCFTFFFAEATDQVEAYRGNRDIKRVNGIKWKKFQFVKEEHYHIVWGNRAQISKWYFIF